jgi:hypothetical protein
MTNVSGDQKERPISGRSSDEPSSGNGTEACHRKRLPNTVSFNVRLQDLCLAAVGTQSATRTRATTFRPCSRPGLWLQEYVADFEVEVTLQLTDSQSICLGIEYPCGTCDQMLFPVGMLLSEICGLVSIGRHL